MIRKEIMTYNDFVMVAYSDNTGIALKVMAEFRQRNRPLYQEYLSRFRKNEGKTIYMKYRPRKSIFD